MNGNIKICSLGFNQEYSSFGSDNGLAPTRRQAIIWTNDVLVSWRIYASLGLNVLTQRGFTTCSKTTMYIWFTVQCYFVVNQYNPISDYRGWIKYERQYSVDKVHKFGGKQHLLHHILSFLGKPFLRQLYASYQVLALILCVHCVE